MASFLCRVGFHKIFRFHAQFPRPVPWSASVVVYSYCTRCERAWCEHRELKSFYDAAPGEGYWGDMKIWLKAVLKDGFDPDTAAMFDGYYFSEER